MPRTLISFGTCFLLIGMFALTSCSSKEKKLKAKQAGLYFNAGTHSLIEQQYTEALKALLKANELEPDNSEIINNLGMAYYFKGEKDLALKHIKHALQLNENNTDARLNLASIYLKDGKISEAETLYKKVLEDLTYDKQARTYYNLGIIEFTRRQNLVAAEKYFKDSINEDNNYCPAYFQLGLINMKRRKFSSAERNFKEASMGPCYENPAPLYYRGLSFIHLKKYDDARMKLDEVESRFPKSHFARKARTSLAEITQIESRSRNQKSHATRFTNEDTDF